MLSGVGRIIVLSMILPRFRRHESTAPVGDATSTVDARELARMFAAPKWLQDLGLVAWFVVGVGAWVLGVPLAATIAVVTLVTAYVPFIGAIVSGAFAVLLTLSSQGTEAALVMLVIVLLANGLLQNIVQPVAFGATLDLNPLAVLVLTIGAGCLFGMIGMVLAAPIASAAVHMSRDLALARAGVATEEPAPEAPLIVSPSGG